MGQYLTLGIIVASGLIALSGRVPSRWRIVAIVVCGSAILAILILVVLGNRYLGEELSWYNTSPYRQIIFFVVMLVGMVSRQISVAIETYVRKRDKQKKGKKISFVIDPIELFYRFCFQLLPSVR